MKKLGPERLCTLDKMIQPMNAKQMCRAGIESPNLVTCWLNQILPFHGQRWLANFKCSVPALCPLLLQFLDLQAMNHNSVSDIYAQRRYQRVKTHIPGFHFRLETSTVIGTVCNYLNFLATNFQGTNRCHRLQEGLVANKKRRKATTATMPDWVCFFVLFLFF